MVLPEIICTLLLLATIICLIVGFVELLGLFSTGVRRGGLLVIGVILLVIYIVLC